MVVSAASIWLAVHLTPMQLMSAAGQTVPVGAARPGTSLSGPAELDLFGEAIATRPHFDGPMRPRLKLAHIDLGSQIDDATHDGGDELLPVLSRRLASGWLRYCLWESLIAAGCAATIAVAVAGVRRSRRTMVAMTAAAVASVCGANAIGVYLLASGTPRHRGRSAPWTTSWDAAGADRSSGLVTRHGGAGGVCRRVGLVDGLRDV